MEILKAQREALLAPHSADWSADVRAVLPKCGTCEGKGALPINTRCPNCKGALYDPAYSLTFYKGLVGGVSAPSAGLWGAVCERCRGDGMIGNRNDREECPVCTDDNPGRTPGILPALVRTVPLVGATATDKRPDVGIGGTAFWTNGYRPDAHDELPAEIWDRLEGWEEVDRDYEMQWKTYTSLALAHAALSIATINHYRALAELPLLNAIHPK